MLERKLDQYRSEIMICEDGTERHCADASKAHGGNNRLMMLFRAFTDVNDQLERKFDELKKAKMTIPIVWRETKEGRKASLDSYCLHLVNREIAAEDLLIIHESNYRRAKGTDWIYGICACASGSGKSSFAMEYINILKSTPVSSFSRHYSVLPLLRSAVTLHAVLRQPDGRESIEHTLLKQIKRQINYGTGTILDFDSFPSNIVSFMEVLVRRSPKPIFLVIDEVTEPFHDHKYSSEGIQAAQLGLFNSFVESVIYRLVKIPGLYLLLCGCAQFLTWAGTKPRDPKLHINGKIYGYRIALDLIYPKKIVDVLTNTFVFDGTADVTLAKFFDLGGSMERLTTYANQLYQVCLGHPQFLLEILMNRRYLIKDRRVKPRDRPRFSVKNEPGNVSERIVKFAGSLFTTKVASLLKAFRDKETHVDIDEVVNDISHVKNLISMIFICIEKVADNRYKLHIPDRVELILQALVGCRKDFLCNVNYLRKIPTDFHYFFQLLIRNKFSQVLSLRKKFKKIDPCFLGSPVLGYLDHLPPSNVLIIFPFVSNRYDFLDAEDRTVPPETAKKLFRENCTPFGSWLLLRHHSNSASLVYLCAKTILLFSVKNSYPDVWSEIESAERMVPGCCGEYRAVLIVASTMFYRDIQEGFEGCGYQVYKPERNDLKLKEIVLLDLTSPEMRAKFFNTRSLEEIAAVEWIVNQKPPKSIHFYR